MTTAADRRAAWTHEGFEMVVGLEVHVELATRTKLFSGSPNRFGDEPNTNIEYKITRGGFPLKDHYGVQRLTPTADGGTKIDYTIAFNTAIPGMAGLVAKQLTAALSKGLPKLVP